MDHHIDNIVVHYKFNSYLLCALQQTTGRSSAEILVFFYELIDVICDVAAKKKKDNSSMRKNLIDYFPGTSIPFQLIVKGWQRQTFDPTKTNNYTGGYTLTCDADLSFPKDSVVLKQDYLRDISTRLMERSLLGGDDVIIPDFSKPEIKTPPMYKKIMESFGERPKKGGNGEGNK